MKAKAIKSTPARVIPAPGNLSASITEAQNPNAVISSRRAFFDPEQRKAMIAEAAFYKAEHRGFASGFELEDWLSAEAEIDGALAHDSLLSA